jgi:hypothetical protein
MSAILGLAHQVQRSVILPFGKQTPLTRKLQQAVSGADLFRVVTWRIYITVHVKSAVLPVAPTLRSTSPLSRYHFLTINQLPLRPHFFHSSDG